MKVNYDDLKKHLSREQNTSGSNLAQQFYQKKQQVKNLNNNSFTKGEEAINAKKQLQKQALMAVKNVKAVGNLQQSPITLSKANQNIPVTQ